MCTFVREKEKDKEEKREERQREKERGDGNIEEGIPPTKASDQVISSSLDIYWSSWPNLNLHYIWKQRRKKTNALEKDAISFIKPRGLIFFINCCFNIN